MPGRSPPYRVARLRPGYCNGHYLLQYLDNAVCGLPIPERRRCAVARCLLGVRAAAHAQVEVRFRHLELTEEDVTHPLIIVPPGVHNESTRLGREQRR